jgi:hypothetical protein
MAKDYETLYGRVARRPLSSTRTPVAVGSG